VTNQAEVTSDHDPQSGNDTSQATTALDASADLVVTKTADLAKVPNPGDSLTYTVTVTNQGPSVAKTVVLTDQLPDYGLTYVSATPGPQTANSGPCTLADHTLTCQPSGPLAVGQAFSWQITLRAPDPWPTPPNRFDQVASAQAATSDPQTANNQAIFTNSGDLMADLSLVKQTTTPPVAGAQAVYHLALTNLGPEPAANPKIEDTLPAGLSFVSSTSSVSGASPLSGSCSVNGVTVTCELSASGAVTPVLEVGQTWTADLTVAVTADLAGGTSLTNQASASSVTLDPSLANNQASVTDLVTTSTDLAVDQFSLTPPAGYHGAGSRWTADFTLATPRAVGRPRRLVPLRAARQRRIRL